MVNTTVGVCVKQVQMERVTDVPSNFGLKVCRCPEETRGKKLLVYVYGPIYIME